MIIKVKVKTNSKEDFLEKISDFEYKIYVKDPARKGKANEKVIKLLSKEFKVNSRFIKIKNPKSKDKLIEIKE